MSEACQLNWIQLFVFSVGIITIVSFVAFWLMTLLSVVITIFAVPEEK